MFKSLALLVLLASPSHAGKFDNPESESALPGIKFSGLLDLRAYSTDRPVSWLRGGPNRLRFGGRDVYGVGTGTRHTMGASVAQASLVADAQVHADVAVHVQTNFTTDSSSVTSSVGVIEAYVKIEKTFADNNLRLRLGGLIPPLSWEHPGPAWSTRYTLTPSAIGSWVSEEVRALGAELVWDREVLPQTRLRLTAAGFSGGDQIGRLLWFRGWTLDDLQGDLLVQYPTLGRKVRPLEELDGRLGSYWRGDVSLWEKAVQLGGGYWTNDGDEAASTTIPEDQPYRTHLYHYGGKIEWDRFTVISQFMRVTVSGNTRSARDWPSAYVLGSALFGPLRLSARYDRFWTINWSDAKGQGDNGEAYTAFAGYDVALNQQVAVEFVHAYGRPSQAVRPQSQVDRLLEANYRLRF